MASESTLAIVAVVRAVPKGRVLSYGVAAAMAGMSKGARQVVRVLNSKAEAEGLPWWRILRKDGTIALPRGGAFELQKALLEAEGVAVDAEGRVDLGRFAWDGRISREPARPS